MTAMVLFLVGAGSAAANPLAFTSCVSAAAVAGCETAPSGNAGLLNDPIGIALAPGGTQLYVAQGNTRITWLRRNTDTGAIALPPAAAGADRCVWSGSINTPCAPVHLPALTPQTMRISPDGANLYLAHTAFPFQLVNYARNAGTGGLAFSQCLALTTAGCSPIGINNAASIVDLAVSPDGTSVYAANSNATSILNFSRAGSGTLTFRDCVGPAGGCVATGAFPNFNTRPQSLVVSPDGSRVYVGGFGDAGQGGGRVVEYNRGAGGTLTQSSCIGEGVAGCGPGRALSTVNGMAISSDGRTLYTLGGTRVGVIDLDPATGNVSQAADTTGCLADTGAGDPGCTPVRQLGTTTDVVVSPAGDAVYLTNTDSSIAALGRAPNGDLSQPVDAAGCVTAAAVANCVQRAGLVGAGSLAISPDGLTLMLGSAGAGGLGTVTAFTRDLPPVCSDGDAAVAFQTPLAIPLTCTDRNGDPLSYEIVSDPAKGRVTLSQSPPQVIYEPLANNEGGDAFTFRATARGRTSNVATVRPSIGAPPVVAPPPGGGGGGGTTVIVNQGGGGPSGSGPGRIDSPVSTGFKLTGARTRITRLLVRDVPAGAAIEVRCKGPRRSCPYKTKRYRVPSATARVNLLSPYGKRTLAAATTIEVRITRPGTIGKVTRITTRRRKLPLSRTLCLPVGVTAPQPSCLG